MASVRSLAEVRSTLSFLERYDELRTLGILDWEIAKRMGLLPGSLLRMLEREGRTGSELLRAIAKEEEEQ
jgi:hypothetical protein